MKLRKLIEHIQDKQEWLKECESTVQSLMELRLEDQQQIETLQKQVDELKNQLESSQKLRYVSFILCYCDNSMYYLSSVEQKKLRLNDQQCTLQAEANELKKQPVSGQKLW